MKIARFKKYDNIHLINEAHWYWGIKIMSSYVAVTGVPTGETCGVFGLTPQEIRYLQASI